MMGKGTADPLVISRLLLGPELSIYHIHSELLLSIDGYVGFVIVPVFTMYPPHPVKGGKNKCRSTRENGSIGSYKAIFSLPAT